MIIAPPWAFYAEAIDGIGDTHLAKGRHVRVVPAPEAGLPATPLFVYRSVIGGDLLQSLGQQTSVTWIDSYGNVLAVPFEVKPENPVTGYLTGGRAIYARLAVKVPGHNRCLFEALVNGRAGFATAQQRSSEPFVLAGQRIDAVRVSGRGTVLGLSWIDRDKAIKRARMELWTVWSLPVDPAPRYRPTPNAQGEAKDRTARGAPQRIPLYGVMGQSDPGTAPPAGDAFSLARIVLLKPALDEWLTRVLTDLSQPTFELMDVQVIDGGNGELSAPIEPHLLLSSLDPDVGHWMGFGDVDESPADEGQLVLYFIRGLWRYAQERWHPLQRLMLASNWTGTVQQAVSQFPDLANHGLEPNQAGPFIDLTALAAVVSGFPPDPLPQVTFAEFQDLGWMPEPPPPDVRRHIRVRLGGLAPRALLAAVATDPVLRTLNSVIGQGRPDPGDSPPPEAMTAIPVSRPATASAQDEGVLDDRDAGEAGPTYKLSQGDWFGRWGSWAAGVCPAKLRVPPLAPVIELTYQPPAIPTPMPDGQLAGTVTLRIPILRPSEVPPGGNPLSALQLDRTEGSGPPTSQTVDLSDPGTTIETNAAATHDILVVSSPGPMLERSASTTLKVIGRWVDQAGLVSPDSAPAQRTIMDPRPPPIPRLRRRAELVCFGRGVS